MQKDFDDWNNKKKNIHTEGSVGEIFFRTKEVWWCALGLNIGFEQDGKGENFRRPVLILKKFNQYVALAIPITSKPKEGKYYVPCNLGDKIARKAITSQIRLIDTKRLIDKLGVADNESFESIKKAIKDYL